MNEKNAFKLFQDYVNGWKHNDLPMILASLDEDCVIIESHGPTYRGLSEISHWFKLWLNAKSQIIKWDISSFYFLEKKKTAFAEWDFSCVSNDKNYVLPGITVIQFSEEKILFIHEYRMTHQAYQWQKDQLKSE